MADEDLLSLADTVLTPASEHEWALLWELIDFADRLVVAFIFADRFPVRVLRARMQRGARESGMPFRLLVSDEPEALRNDALAGVLAPEAAREITWFEAFGKEDGLRQAWLFAAQRWNEHREPLRRSSLRALIVAAPIWAKPVIRLAAPDLWSITNLVIEPAALPAPTFFEAPKRIAQRAGGTPAERAVAELGVEGVLSLPPRSAERDRNLIEALANAVRAGAWTAAARAADGLDLAPKNLRRMVGQAKSGGQDALSALAASLNNLGAHLSSLGRLKEALRISQVSVDLYRDLARSQPVMFLPRLANSLQNLGLRLGAIGRNTDAVAVTQEAIRVNRDLAIEALPSLAMSLGNLSGWLFDLGHLQEALSAAQEATAIFQALADQSQLGFRLDLAMSLNNQAEILVRMERLQEALALMQDAVNLNREMAALDSIAIFHTRAASLDSLGRILLHLGRYEEALAAAEEAVAVTAGLARSKPEIFMQTLQERFLKLKLHLKRAQKDPGSSAALRDGEALLSSAGLFTS